MLTTLMCKQIIVAASKELKTGCNLVESSKRDCGSKRIPSQMMMMMTMAPSTLFNTLQHVLQLMCILLFAE
jgi:hypothetical protein